MRFFLSTSFEVERNEIALEAMMREKLMRLYHLAQRFPPMVPTPSHFHAVLCWVTQQWSAAPLPLPPIRLLVSIPPILNCACAIFPHEAAETLAAAAAAPAAPATGGDWRS